ncbi:MAG: glycosyltransferase family 4 protein [Bacteroidota bacterium]
MRVLMVTGSYPPQRCGVGYYTHKLVAELNDAGVEIDVATTKGEQPRDDPNVRYEVPDWKTRTWWRTVGEMKKGRYDLIHVQYPARHYGYRPDLAGLTLTLKRRYPGVPVVVTVHEFSITHILRKLTVGAIVSPAAAIVTTADSERNSLLRWLPWLTSRMRVIHVATNISRLSVSTDRRREVRWHCGVKDEDRLVVFFGLLHQNKGVRRLFETFAILRSLHPEARLLMLTEFKPEENAFHAELDSLTKELHIRGAVIWKDFRDSAVVSELLSSSDVAFMPFEDGVTLRRTSFMAVMGHGLPTVTTVGRETHEELGLDHGRNVYLLQQSSSNAEMAEAVSGLIEDAGHRREVGAAALKWSEPFTWSLVVEKTVEVYQAVLRGELP